MRSVIRKKISKKAKWEKRREPKAQSSGIGVKLNHEETLQKIINFFSLIAKNLFKFPKYFHFSENIFKVPQICLKPYTHDACMLVSEYSLRAC